MLSPAGDPQRGTRGHRCAHRALPGEFVRIVQSARGSVAPGKLHPAARNPAGAYLRLSTHVVCRPGGAVGDTRGGAIEPTIASLLDTSQIPAMDPNDRSHGGRGGGELRICAAAPAE